MMIQIENRNYVGLHRHVHTNSNLTQTFYFKNQKIIDVILKKKIG